MRKSSEIDVPEEINHDMHDVKTSIINKCSLHVVTCINSMISEIPSTIPNKTQKLDLTLNLLRDIPLTLTNLK